MKQIFLCLIIFLFCSQSQAQLKPKNLSLEDKILFDPQIKKVVLPSGFTYYFRRNTYPENKLELRLVVNAGSVLEEENQQGLAHFLEHMNFNGSEHFKKNELVSYLQSVGVSFGADLNAYTSFDETVYILPIPTKDSAVVEKGFQIMQDWSHLALLTDKDIDEERNIVLEESRLRRGANFRMIQKLLPALYEGTDYANRLPIGIDTILKNFKPEVLKKFHKTWYRPDLSALIIVGDIEEKKASQLVNKYFENWKNDGAVIKRKTIDVPKIKKNKAAVIIDAEQTAFVVDILFSPKKNKDVVYIKDYKQVMMRQLLRSILSMRISELIQSATPPFVNASIGFDGSLARNYDNLSLSVYIGKAGINTAIQSVIDELKKAQQFGFTDFELDIAKKQILSYMQTAANEKGKTQSARFAEEYIRNFLTNEFVSGIEMENQYTKFILPLITTKDIQEMLNEAVNNENYFALLIAPKAEEQTAPKEADLLKKIEEAFGSKISKTEAKILPTEILATQPEKGKILQSTTDTILKTTNFELSNGIKVIVKKTDFKADQILFSLTEKGGIHNFSPNQYFTNLQLISVLESMGWGNFSPNDLQKILSGKQIGLSPYFNSLSHGFNGASNVQDLESFFQLFYLKATQPRINKDLFESFKENKKAAVKFAMQDPISNFKDTFQKILFNNHPYTPIVVPKPDNFDKIDLMKIQEIYPAFWHQTKDALMVIVGNVDIEKLKTYLEKYVASIPNSQKTSEIVDVELKQKNDFAHPFFYQKGTDDKAFLSIYSEKPEIFDIKKNVQIAVLNEVLNIRLIEEIREKKSWVYGLRASLSLNKYPRQEFNATFSFPCGQKNIDSIRTGLMKEIKDLQTKPASELNLQKAKKQLLEHLREGQKTNEYWKGIFNDIYIWKEETPESILKADQMIEGVTLSDIQKIATDCLNLDKHSFIGILTPESKSLK